MNDAELRLALVLEASGEGLWEFLPAEGLVLQHPAFLALLGLPPRAQSEPVDAFFARIHEEERRHLVNALFEATEPFELRLRIRHADSSWRWHRARGRRVGSRVVVVESDISAELQREAAIADTLSRYLALYDNAPMGFIVWDREGRITDWNKQAEQLFGHARNTIMGRRFISLLFPSGIQDQVVEQARRLLQSGGAYQGEYLNLAADGSPRRCLWNNVALRGSKGSVSGVLSLITDTTATWQAELERGHNEARNRALIETSPDAIFVLDLEGKVVNANQEAQRLLEVEDRSELVAQAMANWLLPGQRAQFIEDVLINPEDRIGFVSSGEYALVGSEGAQRLI